jgi:threonine/homoserine/homoserine lactone efflux protein
MYLTLLEKGFGIGLLVAAIVGPIAILCIRSTLTHGQAIGLAIGLGASLADALFGLVAALGLSFVADFMIGHQYLLRFLGGSFLLYLGIKTFFEEPAQQAAVIHSKGLLSTTASTFLLTLSNPVTIFSFTAIFAASHIDTESINRLHISLLVGGIFIGSMVWWGVLTSILKIFHARMNKHTLTLINKCSGGILAGFGALTIISLLVK